MKSVDCFITALKKLAIIITQACVKIIPRQDMSLRKVLLLSELMETSSILRSNIVFEERDHWVHPINAKRDELGEFHHLIPELKEDAERFYGYFRMLPKTYTTIFNIVKSDLIKEDIGFRRPVSAEERFALTLR